MQFVNTFSDRNEFDISESPIDPDVVACSHLLQMRVEFFHSECEALAWFQSFVEPQSGCEELLHTPAAGDSQPHRAVLILGTQ